MYTKIGWWNCSQIEKKMGMEDLIQGIWFPSWYFFWIQLSRTEKENKKSGQDMAHLKLKAM